MYASYTPYQKNDEELRLEKIKELEKQKIINNKKKYLINKYRLQELQSNYFGMDTYYLMKIDNKIEIVKINNINGNFEKTSYDEEINIKKLNKII